LSLFKLSTIVYGSMTLAGIAIAHYGHENLISSFAFPGWTTAGATEESLRLLGIGAVAATLLLVLSYNFENWFRSFRDLKATIMRLLGPCTLPMALYLAGISAFGEEILFRAAI